MHFKDYINLVEMNIQEHVDYHEASQHSNWRATMESKIESIHNNKTWELTKLLVGLKVIQSGYSRSRK
jgi:hypothetical protein